MAQLLRLDRVYAEAPGLARFSWSLKAYAVCAPRSAFNNYTIKAAITYVSPSETFEAVEAVCPEQHGPMGRRRARLQARRQRPADATGQLGLQLMRTDGALGIARATARESANGYNGSTIEGVVEVLGEALSGRFLLREHAGRRVGASTTD